LHPMDRDAVPFLDYRAEPIGLGEEEHVGDSGVGRQCGIACAGAFTAEPRFVILDEVVNWGPTPPG
jgi:hypothetical protein